MALKLMLHTVTAMAVVTTVQTANAGLAGTALANIVLAQAASPLEIPGASPAPPAAGQTVPSPEAGQPPATPEAPAAGNPEAPDQQAEPDQFADEDDMPSDDFSLGEIPVIETIELTPDMAKRALDSFIAAKAAYSDSGLEQFEDLQDFVDQTDDGKKFDADIKAAGFKDVNDWNLAITTLGVTYASVIDDQTSELLLQIEEIEADTELAQDIKDRMVKALRAMIPSENNKKVVEELLADPVYGPKLKELDIEEE